MQKPVVFLPLAAALCILFSACDNSPGDPGYTLKVDTIKYVRDNDGFYQFASNDKQYCGYAFWFYWNNGLHMTNGGTIIEAQVKKLSGAKNFGYGLIFGYTNNNSYQLLINYWGWYCLLTRMGNTFNMLMDWSFSPYLITGYNKINTIKVSNNNSGFYDIYFNDIFVNRTSSIMLTEGTGLGFISSIGYSSNENFPMEPVDCRFKLLGGTN